MTATPLTVASASGYGPAQVEQDLRRWRELADAADCIASEQEGIKARLRTIGTGKHHYATGTVTVSPQRRFNAKLAEQLLPAETFQQICETRPSATLARKILAPTLVDACMAEQGDPAVRIS